MTLNKKNRATLQAIFEKPTRADIKWSRMENLFWALGGIVQQRSSSRVFLSVNGVSAVIHKPHPRPETGKADVEDVRANSCRPPASNRKESPMSTMKHGPYVAKVTYEDDIGMFRGSVINTRDVITFCSDSVAGLEQEFANSVQEYLASCEEHGIEPAKTFSGQIPLRLKPELHGQIYARAADAGVSVAAYIRETLEKRVGGA